LAGLLSFNSQALIRYLDELGIQKTWVNLLATHLNTRDDLKYVLAEKEFQGFQILNEDIISDLSVGEIGVLYEFSVAHVDAGSRKDNGQYFTPDDVAEFMARKTSLFPEGIWLDPCSGVGNLSWHLVKIQRNQEDFLLNNLILSDRDPLALLIARTLFTIDFQNTHSNLFNELEKSFILFDFLSVSDEDGRLPGIESPLSKIPTHDFVIVNPPYLAISPANTKFETKRSRDLYAYFLENIIKTSVGFVSVTPQSFTNAGKFEDLRRLLIEHFPNLTIYNFDNVPANMFHGIKFGSKNSNKANSIRSAITVAIKSEGRKRITSLIRWRSGDRAKMFDSVDSFLSEAKLTIDFFPKVSKYFERLYSEVEKLPRFSTLLESNPTNFVLHVPSSPRYFIPALKSPVSRSSMHTLYFRNEDDLLKAYLLINSSFMYWWWRVRDGGMTLSLETIGSMPLINFEVKLDLVEKLEKSESENKVYKKNAGVDQENVKHPTSLINELNESIIPKYAELLITTHENSELEFLRFSN
jgi:hypothetical protein